MAPKAVTVAWLLVTIKNKKVSRSRSGARQILDIAEVVGGPRYRGGREPLWVHRVFVAGGVGRPSISGRRWLTVEDARACTV